VAGDTPEANDLAEWLRKVKGERTLRQLEELLPSYRRSQWGEFLKGRKLIPPWLLDDFVTALVRPQDQQLQRGIGRSLLAEAEKAAAARRTAESSGHSSHGTLHDIQLRLDNARQGQIKAQETVQGLTHLIYGCLTAMAGLQQRCQHLEAERDEARLQLHQHEEHTTASQRRAAENKRRLAETERRLADTEQRLAEAQQQCARIQERLDRAHRKRQEAEDLRFDAFLQGEQHRHALEQRTGRSFPAASSDGAGDAAAPSQSWENDYFLEVADSRLDAFDAQITRIRADIGTPLSPAPDAPRIIPGQTVPAPSTDGTDGVAAGTGPARGGLSMDGADNAAGTGSTAGSPSTADTSGPSTTRSGTSGRSARSPRSGTSGTSGDPSGVGNRPERLDDPPPNGSEPRRRRSRTGRVVLVGATCLAVLAAGGGWLLWDHSHAEYTVADSPTLAQARERHELDIGVKPDQPGMSVFPPTGGSPKGFEIDLARFIARELDVPEEEIKWKKVSSESREDELSTPEVDLLVATYSINKEREKKFAFAGPYYTTGQSLLMRKGDHRGEAIVYDPAAGRYESKLIQGMSELPDGTRSCTAKSSTSETAMKKGPYKAKFHVQTASTYEACVSGLLHEKYDVVATDSVILAGYYSQHRKSLVKLGFNFTSESEKYGVAMRKGDPALQYLTCRAIQKAIDGKAWRTYYNTNLRDLMNEEGRTPTPECHGR
jgi:ABC-type amino acid transport substrate-binding protein